MRTRKEIKDILDDIDTEPIDLLSQPAWLYRIAHSNLIVAELLLDIRDLLSTSQE